MPQTAGKQTKNRGRCPGFLISVCRHIHRLSGNLPIPGSRFPARDMPFWEMLLLPGAAVSQLPATFSDSDRFLPGADATWDHLDAPWLPADVLLCALLLLPALPQLATAIRCQEKVAGK